MKLPTRQEMFNRAAKGLRKQGFLRSMDVESCIYDDGEGRRCAWGHVDKSLTKKDGAASVYVLRRRGRGLAGHLLPEDVGFAATLQDAHDHALSPNEMRQGLFQFAKQYSLHTQELK